jgi:FixJ family two-component response regulator
MIFIIDDDKNVSRGFQILLKSAGLASRIFDSVEEFIEKWDQDSNDILILDIHMPGLNGCDLLNYLEELSLHVAVIVVTAYDETASHDQANRYGTLAYLTKPVNDIILLDLLKNENLKQASVAN